MISGPHEVGFPDRSHQNSIICMRFADVIKIMQANLDPAGWGQSASVNSMTAYCLEDVLIRSVLRARTDGHLGFEFVVYYGETPLLDVLIGRMSELSAIYAELISSDESRVEGFLASVLGDAFAPELGGSS